MSHENIKTIKQGYPFSPSAVGYGITALVIAAVATYQLNDIYKLITIPFYLIGVYLFFVRRELILDLNNNRFKLADSVLGLKLGSWHNFSEIKGITIKYTILTDKTKGANQYALMTPYGIMGIARWSPNQYKKDETWIVKTYDSNRKAIQILNVGKEEALTALIHILNKNKEAKPYLAHYRKDYELKKAELSKGKLELVTPKPKRGKYY